VKHYCAQPKQILFHLADADETLYGGAAGGGKSYAVIWDAVIFAKTNLQVNVSIFRRTYPELEKSIILEALRTVPQPWYTYNKKEHRMYFDNGSIVEFNYCQYETDMYNFQSAQYERIYFDELTHFSESIYRYLQSRCRTTKENIKPQIKCASNPGNIGHGWVKARFVDGALPNTKTDRVDPESQVTYTTTFIPARVYDNKYIIENDPEYVKRLMKLNTDDRRGLLEGDWEILKGQFFTEFRPDLHVIKPIEIPKYWTRIRSIDWGYAKPCAVLWIAFDPDQTAYVYRELVVTETTDQNLAKKIRELTGQEEISYTTADPSMWSINQYEKGESIAHRLMRYKVPVIKADNNRIAGWNVIHSYLTGEKEKPKLFIFHTCEYLIKTLPSLIHDERNPEDLNSKGDDHAADSLRYALMTKPMIPKKPTRNIPRMSVAYFLNKAREERMNYGYVGQL
jgi:PBSX family phage terminase large subunit